MGMSVCTAPKGPVPRCGALVNLDQSRQAAVGLNRPSSALLKAPGLADQHNGRSCATTSDSNAVQGRSPGRGPEAAVNE